MQPVQKVSLEPCKQKEIYRYWPKYQQKIQYRASLVLIDRQLHIMVAQGSVSKVLNSLAGKASMSLITQ